MEAGQYAGRSLDVAAIQGATAHGVSQLQQTLFSDTNSGQVCTGLQKMAQRWLLEFMTIRGSMPWGLQMRGTDFMRLLRRGELRTEADVQAAYLASGVQAWQNLTNEDTGAEPADERFASSSLLGIVLEPGKLTLRVSLLSAAGTSYTVILPVSTTPANLTV